MLNSLLQEKTVGKSSFRYTNFLCVFCPANPAISSLVADSLSDNMEGQGDTEPPSQQQDVQGNKVICDGLLCSILRAMSYSANKEEFVSVIERDCDEQEVLTSRKKLFTFYSDVMCDKQKKPVLYIKG